MENDLKASADYSASGSITGAQIMALVRGLVAADGKSPLLIVEDIAASTPDVSTYPRYANYLAYDKATHKIYYYDDPDWIAIDPGDITIASIADHLITLLKLDVTSAASAKCIGFDGTNAAWRNIVDIIANNSLAVNKLDAGTSGAFLRSVSGVNEWTAIADVATAIAAAITSYDITKLSGRIASALLVTDGTSAAAWSSWATFFDTILTDNVIKLKKLAGEGASDLQVPTWDGTKFAPATPVFSKYYDSVIGAGFHATDGVEQPFDVTSTFGNGVLPKWVRATIQCVAAGGDGLFARYDELEISSVSVGGATSNKTPFTVRTNLSGSTVKVFVSFLGYNALGSTPLQASTPGTPAALQTLDHTKWGLRLRAGV